jgi:hypothetical protein
VNTLRQSQETTVRGILRLKQDELMKRGDRSGDISGHEQRNAKIALNSRVVWAHFSSCGQNFNRL